MSRRQRRERRDRRKRHAEPRALRTRQSLITGATVTAGALVGFSSTAIAQDFQVNSLADNGDGTCDMTCTLRDAVHDANNGGDVIDNVTFQSGLSGQITLTDDIYVSGGTYFLGPGANILRISGGNQYRIFSIDEDTAGTPVGIYNLSLMYGHAIGSGAAGSGGAVFNQDALLKVVGTVLARNTADASGGAIYDKGDFSQGLSDYIINSTISTNTAALKGGGLYGYFSLGTIQSSTISGNQQTDGTSTNGGGGVASYSPTSINDSTVANNTSGNIGGGLWLGYSGGPDQLANTIVADNSAASSDPDTRGRFDSQFSLIENPGDATITSTVAGSNLTGVDPQLAGLSDNGGPTPTQLPAVASPAIDQGKRVDPRNVDQRGLTRPFDVPTIPNSAAAGADGSDIGAVELQASELPSNSFSAKTKGTTLLVSVTSAGSVGMADAKAPLAASANKKKRKLLLDTSSGSGGPPTIAVKLRLTKLAKQKLREKGKVTVKARITFTPNRGIPKTVTQKLKIKSKKKK